ncbi:MAG: hypothetical protein R8K50_06875, partial [Mariprofundus sp.]
LGPLIDIALVIAMAMLWRTWYRNGKRQQALESLLAGTAEQLEEATRHLAEATQSIQALKQQHSRKQQPVEQEAEEIAEEVYRPRQPRPTPAAPEPEAPPPPQHSTQATMILRMHREGETAETIADRLDMPLAQVKLMLTLHTASTQSTRG